MKKWKQSFKFYLSASGTDDNSKMRTLLLHCTGPDVQDIFMHVEDAGTTYKVQHTINALNNHFETKKNVVFKGHVFRQPIQRANEPSINFVSRLRKLASRVNLSIKTPKSEISSLASAHLIAYVLVYCKNPILY